MSLTIIQPRTRVERIELRRAFEWDDCPGAGFSFDLDADGEIVVTDGNRANVEQCLSGDGLTDCGIEEIDMSYTEAAVGKCPCGRKVHLESVWTNPCGCGRSYNSCGQELAHPSQWGEETGELYSDIIRPLGINEVV
jgi:hypothetical protein